MKPAGQKHLPALAVALLWAGINLLIINRFPTVYLDEPENANHAYNLAYHHAAVFSLYDDLYPRPLYELRQAWPVVIRPFYVYPLAGWIKLLGFSYTNTRLFSLLAGFLSLLGVYWAGWLVWNRRLGLVSMIFLALRFSFLFSSDRIRPEMLLCLCGVSAFVCLLYSLKRSSPWLGGAAGLLAGAAAGIHTNGIALILPVLGLLIFQRRAASALLCCLGWAAGAFLFLCAADWARFLPGVHALFFQEFSSPSILKVHGNVFRAISLEFERYFGGWDFYDWRGGAAFHMVNGWQYALSAAAVCWGCARKDSLKWPAQFAALLALSYACFVGQKAFPYLSVLEPYFALSVAAWMLSAPPPSMAAAGACVALMIALLPFGKLPAVLILSISLLPKKALQWTLLGLLAAFLLIAPELRTGFAGVFSDYGKYGALPAVASLIFAGICAMKKTSLRLSPIAAGWAVCGVTMMGTLLFVGSIAAYKPSFETLCKSMASKMRPGSKVAGPQVFWLGLNSYDYRDIGVIVWHRLLMGEKDLTRPLASFKPDYMIVSKGLALQIRRLNDARKAPGLQPGTGLFPWPHRVLDIVDAGAVYGGELILIENQWASRIPRR